MANILVTGGAGFIGSHTVLALQAVGHNIIVLDNLSNGSPDNLLFGELVVGDIRDGALLDRVFAEHEIEAVVHFAASIEAGESVRDPMAFYANNVGGSLSLIQSMVRCAVRSIVFSSTAAVYGQNDQVDILSEELPKKPINPYGHSKWMVECMLKDTSETGVLDAIALRYFNAAGGDPEGRIGEQHDPETHLIPLALDAARGTRDEVKIFGTDYATPDGTCIRDYIHVSDLADAHALALGILLDRQDTTNDQRKAGSYDAFNLGTSKGHSVRDVMNTAKKVTGIDFPVIEDSRRPGDPARLVADASRAQSELNWSPTRSDLTTLVEDAWRFRKTLGK